MKRKTLFLLISLLLSVIVFSQTRTGVLTGLVVDATDGSPIPFANVTILDGNYVVIGGMTDFDGRFNIRPITPGIYSVSVNYLGYATSSVDSVVISSRKNIILNFYLEPAAETLNEVEIKDYRVSLIDPSMLQSPPRRSLVGQSYLAESHPYINTESYDIINENVFKRVIKDPLSTFSVDVDRASYSNVRRFLNNSKIPNRDAVRIEELINYFDYKYEEPKGKHPFAVHVEVGPCAWNNKTNLMMIGIQGKNISADDIPASNLVFLIDVSGSMRPPNRLPLLKEAFRILVEKLRPQDRVSIVVYAGAAGCVLPTTGGDHKKTILEAIDKLEAGGSTAGGAGIKLAYEIASENFIKDGQ